MSDVFDSVRLSPEAALAGDSVEFVIRLVIGQAYTRGESRLVVSMPGTLGMSRPNTFHGEDDGFVEIVTDNPDVRWRCRTWDHDVMDFTGGGKSGYRNRPGRLLVVDLTPGLGTGNVLEIHWGTTRWGYGVGTKVTTVVPHPAYCAELLVKYYESHDDGLPDMERDYAGHTQPTPAAAETLRFEVIPRQPDHLRLIRRPGPAALQVLDRFENCAPVEDLADLVDADAPADRNDHDVWQFTCRDVRVVSKSLPLAESPDVAEVGDGYNVYFGDVHTHSAFSNDCYERERLQMPPEKMYAAARRRGQVDFLAITDHHQPWDEGRNRIGPERWARTCAAAAAADAPGEFLALTGFEFRSRRGDTAVVLGEPMRYDEIFVPAWQTIRELWEGLAGRQALTIPHFHNPGRLEEGEWWQGPELIEPVLELFSCHGSYEVEAPPEAGRADCKQFRPDRTAAWMLQQGCRYGLVANSDGHKGRPGSFGLTGVLARELTVEAIFEAYRARRVFATTNARFRMVFRSGPAWMGSVLPAEAQRRFQVELVGESALKRVELMRAGHPHTRLAHQADRCQADLTVDDDGPGPWYVRAAQVNGETAWSSPIWFA